VCRGQNICTELGPNSQNWPTNSPLERPSWFENEIESFIVAMKEICLGDKGAGLKMLASIRSTEITNWYVEHGQMSGRHRWIGLGAKRLPALNIDERDPLRSPKKFELSVFVRDGFRCRYCNSRLLDIAVLKWLDKELPQSGVNRGRTNLETHGIIHLMWPVADHIIPWNLGGPTSLDNLVSSCPPCNYGKAGYTLGQIGLTSPLNRPTHIDGWDGLISILSHAKTY